METLLRKYLSVVDLAVIALCAIFAARATATAIEAGFVSGIPSAKHAAKPAVAAPPPLQRTSLPLKLLAVMYAPTDPRWSMAIIRDNDDKSTGPFGVGSKLREATVDQIEETRAYLDFGGGRREYLELLDEPATPAAAPAAVAPPPGP